MKLIPPVRCEDYVLIVGTEEFIFEGSYCGHDFVMCVNKQNRIDIDFSPTSISEEFAEIVMREIFRLNNWLYDNIER